VKSTSLFFPFLKIISDVHNFKNRSGDILFLMPDEEIKIRDLCGYTADRQQGMPQTYTHNV